MNEISKYINHWKKISELVLSFIDNDDEKMSDALKDQINFVKQNKRNLQTFLQLLSNITLNHHRNKNFSQKVEEILSHLIESLKQFGIMSYPLFKIFMNNNRILYYLFEQRLIVAKHEIYLMINEKLHYFYPVIKANLSERECDKIKSDVLGKNTKNLEEFDKKCRIGENDSKICELIRNDSINEFIDYVKKGNISLTMRIKPSIFETHYYLNRYPNQTLIEYACFFGSIKIFNYLKANGVILRPHLWIYAIKGRNLDVIHILEKCEVSTDCVDNENCIEESVKCFHNEIADYFINKYMNKSKYNLKYSQEIMCPFFYNSNVYAYAFQYQNYRFMPQKFNNKFYLLYLCEYNYIELVEFLSKTNMFDINVKIDILNEIFNINDILYIQFINVNIKKIF